MGNKRYKKRKITEKLRLFLSNLAHERLAKKHAKAYKEDYNNATAYIKNGYHNSVRKIQESEGRILTQQEKEKQYKSSSYFYYN